MSAAFLAVLCLCFASAAGRNLRAKDSATPALPTRKLTPADWASAAGKFVEIAARRPGVQETLFAKDAAPLTCGKPCVAHCIAGQPREMIAIKGLWKSIKHRLFEQFSDSPIVFALLAMGKSESNGGEEGSAGYVRTVQTEVKNEDILPSLEYLGVDRALLLREECTTGECLQKGLRLKCNAKDLGVTELFDKKSGVYSNLCELQVSRFTDSLELVRDYEAEHNMKFDWVTRPRPDVYFTRPVTAALTLDLNSAHVSPWASCGFGGMDWFYALPRNIADKVAEFSTGVSCSDYKTKPEIAKVCNACPGCECWLAAWMYSKDVKFTKLPWQWFTPSKFCGADCPADWEVTPESVMGVDSRVKGEPCRKKEGSMWCPMLLTVGSHYEDVSPRNYVNSTQTVF